MHGCYNLAVAAWKVKSKKELSVGSVVLFLLSEERFVTSAEDMVIGEREQPGTMVSSLHKEQQNNVVIEWTNFLEHGNKTDIWGVVLLVLRKKNGKPLVVERVLTLGRMHWCLSCLAKCVTTRLANMAEFLPHLRGKWMFLLREVGKYSVTW